MDDDPVVLRTTRAALESHGAPRTGLRQLYQHARSLRLPEQIRECVDQLGHLAIVIDEVLEAFRTIEAWASSGELPPAGEPIDTDAIDLEELASEDFYSTREIGVIGQRYAFTCLASNVDPLGDLRPARRGKRSGLDFVGLTCDAIRTPVLGTVQSERDTTAYPLLLAPEAQRDIVCLRMQRSRFDGRLRLGWRV